MHLKMHGARKDNVHSLAPTPNNVRNTWRIQSHQELHLWRQFTLYSYWVAVICYERIRIPIRLTKIDLSREWITRNCPLLCLREFRICSNLKPTYSRGSDLVWSAWGKNAAHRLDDALFVPQFDYIRCCAVLRCACTIVEVRWERLLRTF